MDNEKLLKRLYEIEEELHTLRKSLEAPAKNERAARLANISKSLQSHSAFVTLVIAGITAIIAYTFFGVDPFENYRAIETTRELSQFHSNLGDDLLFREDWEAAEVEYRTALEIDKNNIQATYGIFQAQIFQPLEGQKYYAPEVADTKLDYLEKKLPNYYLAYFLKGFYEKKLPKNYQVYFLRGTYYFFQQDPTNAQLWLSRAIQLKPDFAAGYIQRGYVKQSTSDIDGACTDYRAALAIEKENGTANNNVGYCEMLDQNFESAIEPLWVAWRNSQRLVSLINLGDAYLFTGKTKEALDVQQYALRLVEDGGDGIENERFIAGELTFNFLPLSQDDKTSKQNSIRVFTLTQKRIFIHYNLSFGYALNGNLTAATTAFNKARRLDNHGDYNVYFEQKMKSIRYFIKMNPDVQNWFEKQERILAQNQEAAK